MPEIAGFDQVVMPCASTLVLPQAGKIDAQENGEFYIVSGDSFRYVFEKRSAAFTELVHNNTAYLAAAMQTNIWRAPTDNDRNVRRLWKRAGYDDAKVRVYSTSLVCQDGLAVITAQYGLSAIARQTFLKVRARYTIGADGKIAVDLSGDKLSLFPFLPRFGIRLFLKKDFEQVSYYGYGPNESYIDKRRASWLDRFEDTVSGMHEDYLMPQENGSHYG